MLKNLKIISKQKKSQLQHKAKSKQDTYKITTSIKKDIVNYFRNKVGKSLRSSPGTIVKDVILNLYDQEKSNLIVKKLTFSTDNMSSK